jgi:hypothetical protein
VDILVLVEPRVDYEPEIFVVNIEKRLKILYPVKCVGRGLPL